MPSHCDACVQIGTNASHQPAKIVEEQHQPNVYAEDGCNEIPSTKHKQELLLKHRKMWEDLEEHHLENLMHL